MADEGHSPSSAVWGSMPPESDEQGVTRMPCPACGSMLLEDGRCTNAECPNYTNDTE